MGIDMGVSVNINQITSRQLLVCVYVMEALLQVLKRGKPQDACMFVHTRSSVGMGVCMCECLSPVLSSTASCVSIYVCFIYRTNNFGL